MVMSDTLKAADLKLILKYLMMELWKVISNNRLEQVKIFLWTPVISAY